MPSVDPNHDANAQLKRDGLFFAVRGACSFPNVEALRSTQGDVEPGDVFPVQEHEIGATGKEGLVEDLFGCITRGKLTQHKTREEAEESASVYREAKSLKDKAEAKTAATGGDALKLLDYHGIQITDLEAKLNALMEGGKVGGENAGLKAEFDAIKERLDELEKGGGNDELGIKILEEVKKRIDALEAVDHKAPVAGLHDAVSNLWEQVGTAPEGSENMVDAIGLIGERLTAIEAALAKLGVDGMDFDGKPEDSGGGKPNNKNK